MGAKIVLLQLEIEFVEYRIESCLLSFLLLQFGCACEQVREQGL